MRIGRVKREGGHPIIPLSREKYFLVITLGQKTGNILATPILQVHSWTSPCIDESLTSTNLVPNRYVYPVCPASAGPSIIPNPDSKAQVRGPELSPPRS
jgi:hypothetical protein